MTETCKLRCREPSRICSLLKIAIQKNTKIRCLFYRVLGLLQSCLHLTISEKVVQTVFEKIMSVLSILLGYRLKREKEGKNYSQRLFSSKFVQEY